MTEPNVAHQGAYTVVARRYRPLDFDALVGQNHVTQALSNAITTGRIGHAYLFTGARGVGKTSSARIFAKSLNCDKGPTPSPCHKCDACTGITSGEDVDVIEIDGASNRGVDEIRQLRQNSAIRPSRSRFKIYIIDEVHMLTREAFNALLKTLEEPPPHIKFIFCTTEPTKIPVTILSRCQRYDFAGIDTERIASHLATIADTEGVTLEDGVADTLARRASGSMRDAQSLLEQLLSFAPQHIRLSDIHQMLGTAGDARIFAVVTALRDQNITEVFEQLDMATTEGVDDAILVEQMMGFFRDMLVVQSGGTAKHLRFTETARCGELTTLASTLGMPRLLAALQLLDHTAMRMRASTMPRVLLEMVLVRISHLQQLEHLVAMVESLHSGTVGSAVKSQAPAHRLAPQMPMSVKETAPKEASTSLAKTWANRAAVTASSAPVASKVSSKAERLSALKGNPFVQATEAMFGTRLVDFHPPAAVTPDP